MKLAIRLIGIVAALYGLYLIHPGAALTGAGLAVLAATQEGGPGDA